MKSYLIVALGGAIGSVARFWFSGLAARHWGGAFPWGTLAVNVIGSFIIGLVAGLAAVESRMWVSPTSRLFIMVGICGGFTTFSSFSLQTLNLARDGEWLRAGANILGSVALCLVGVWAGYLVAAQLNSSKGL
jgi:CrcB protein